MRNFDTLTPEKQVLALQARLKSISAELDNAIASHNRLDTANKKLLTDYKIVSKIYDEAELREHQERSMYFCFCDSFISEGVQYVYVYHDGNICDEYYEGKLIEHTILEREEYDDAYLNFLSRNGGK